MYSAAIEHITLFGGVIQHSIKSETFGPRLQVQQCMLLVGDTDNTFVSTLVFVRHHGSYTERHFHSFAANIRHHGIPIERVHLAGYVSRVEGVLLHGRLMGGLGHVRTAARWLLR
jgi:hypothetical protein